MVNSKPGDYPGVNRAPSIVPPPEWGKPKRELVYGAIVWYIVAKCYCNVEIRPGRKPTAKICDSHTFADCDSGLALLRGTLAQQEKE